MDVVELESDQKLTDSFCYRFNSRVAVLLEKNHKWKDAMALWVYAMYQAKIHENRVWAYRRALYCRKQCIKSDRDIDLPELDIPHVPVSVRKK